MSVASELRTLADAINGGRCSAEAAVKHVRALAARAWPQPNTILVWRWEDAPQEYRDLSTHGGDEDWVVFIPRSVLDAVGEDVWWAWSWLRAMSPPQRPERHDVRGGAVFIEAHA